MANGYFERGEVYWVRMDNGFGGEQGVGRPGLIISNDNENSSNETVTIVFLTTKYWPGKHRVQIEATGTTSYVIHNQVMTYDKTRLGKYIGVLNSAEKKAVDDALEGYFDLGYVDDTALKEKDCEIKARDAVIAEKDAEIAELRKMVAAQKAATENVELSYKVENDMWQKLYEKALNQVVDIKLTGDIQRRVEAPMKKPEPVENPEPPVVDDKVDINHCTITALRKLGFSLPMAQTITERRPYKAVSDLKKVPGMKSTQYQIMEPKLKCTPIKTALPEPDPGYEVPEPVKPTLDDSAEMGVVVRVNVNTASAKEIAEKTGMSVTVAYGIVGKRKRDGAYKTLEDLLNGKRFTQYHLDTYGAMLEV